MNFFSYRYIIPVKPKLGGIIMKKKNFNKKLRLNKKTISNLDRGEMKDAFGGEHTRNFCLTTINTATCIVCDCQSEPTECC